MGAQWARLLHGEAGAAKHAAEEQASYQLHNDLLSPPAHVAARRRAACKPHPWPRREGRGQADAPPGISPRTRLAFGGHVLDLSRGPSSQPHGRHASATAPPAAPSPLDPPSPAPPCRSLGWASLAQKGIPRGEGRSGSRASYAPRCARRARSPRGERCCTTDPGAAPSPAPTGCHTRTSVELVQLGLRELVTAGSGAFGVHAGGAGRSSLVFFAVRLDPYRLAAGVTAHACRSPAAPDGIGGMCCAAVPEFHLAPRQRVPCSFAGVAAEID